MRYSLIVPHYNDTLRLERLLCSLPVVRDDVEVIVVDDCSPDQSAVEELKARWPQVRWLSTSHNAGAGAARNVGLEHAQGEYLVFADSDDEFLIGAFDTFDDYVQKEDQLVYFFADAVQEVDGLPSSRADLFNSLCENYLNDPSELTLERLKLGHVVPWAKVYSRHFVDTLGSKFEEVRVSNDVFFNVVVAVQANKVSVVPVKVYRVVRRAGSLTDDEGLSSMLERIRVLYRLNRKLEILKIPYRVHAVGYLYRACGKGPYVFAVVFREVLASRLLFPVIRRLSRNEITGFLRRSKDDRKERQRI